MKILVVDDRLENREILRMKLGAHGYECGVASHGAEALAKLRKSHYDAIVVDLLMPVMDGYQLINAIRRTEELKTLPIIIYTSTYTDPRDEALVRNLGANAFIVKPATDEQFFKTLAETIAQASRGDLPSRTVEQTELEYLQAYNGRLLSKLEDKVEEVSALNASLEQRIAEATAELREANAELETYVDSVAHDLRAPVNAINGYAAILLDEGETLSAEERRDLLERITRTSKHVLKLMQDLLEYSRLKAVQVEPASVDLVAEAKDARERVLAENERADPAIELVEPLPRVKAVPGILAQCLANLLSNAVKFVAPGVRPHVKLSAETTNGIVRVNVQDNGIGIDAVQQPRVFRVFERVHGNAQYPGTGLGLATVKRAIEKMGGKIGFRSAKGEGSVFWFDLPAAD